MNITHFIRVKFDITEISTHYYKRFHFKMNLSCRAQAHKVKWHSNRYE